MSDDQYTFATTVSGNIDEVEDRVREALGEEGFGVLTEIDVAATLKAKIDHDMPGYKILGACSPPLAKQGIEADPMIGALLPCNVVLRDLQDGTVQVAIADPEAMMAMSGAPGLEDLGCEAKARLLRVVDQLAN